MVEYRFLGPVEAVRGGQPVSLASGKQRALLAALLMARNGVVSADGLIDRLWGDRPPATVSKNLQVVVSQLRKALGDDAIRTAAGGYMLVVDEGATDEEQFEHLLAAGSEQLAAGKPRDAERTLSRALALWRGRPYEDVAYQDFARDEIARLEERRLTAREERFDALVELGRNADASAGLERLVAEHPYRERAIGQLMLALSRSGRRAEALTVYDSARRRMAEDLGIEPGDRLRRLHAAMLESAGDEGAPIHVIAPARRRASGRPLALVVAGGALLVAAAVAGVLVLRPWSDDAALSKNGIASLTGISGDHLGAIDAGRLTIQGQYAVGANPTSVAAGVGGTVYTLNADGQTISRIRLGVAEQPAERRPVKSPSDLVFGGGVLWVSSIERNGGRVTARISEVDPTVLSVRREVELPGSGSRQVAAVPLAFAAGRLYAAAPSGRLVSIDPETFRVEESRPVNAGAIAAGNRAIWAVSGGSQVLRIDPTSLEVTNTVQIPARTGVDELTVGGGGVWVAEPFAGVLWRIRPEPPFGTQSVKVGLSASDVAYGAGAAWVTSGIDGAVVRVDPRTLETRRISTGNAPQRLAVAGGSVLVTVAGPASGLVATRTPVAPGLATLPAPACTPVVYGGDGVPDVLIASDLPLRGPFADTTNAMVQAIQYTLRRHGFRAGRYRVGYQSCDDSDPKLGSYDPARCAENSKAYVAADSVLAVIGSFNSGCTIKILPILNAARPAPLPLVSAASSYSGLTRSAPGNDPGDPARYSRSGVRSFFRVYPSDINQAEADVEVAKGLGVTKAFVFSNELQSWYTLGLGRLFAKLARGHGMGVVGPASPALGADLYRDLTRQLRRQGVDGAFVVSFGLIPPTDSMIRALRKEFGPAFPIIMTDATLPTRDIVDFVGPAADGVYVSGAFVTDPFRQLPPAGQAFVREFSATQPHGVVTTFVPYAAQATEVVLGAIERSNGTRASVLRELRRTRVENGILGSFSFDRYGDMTLNLMPVFQADAGASPSAPDRVFALIQLRGAPAGS